MKKILVSSIFIIACFNAFSQNLDLVVQNNGDYIICKIDSVTDTQIYFRLKLDVEGMANSYDPFEISEYKYECMDKDKYKYSAILTAPVIKSSKRFNADFRKNSIYYGNWVIMPKLSIDRIFPISDNMGFVLGGGLIFYSRTNYIFNAGCIFGVGGMKHFIEFGGSFFTDRGTYQTFYGISGNLGYRFMGKKGLLVKAGIDVAENVPVFPAFGIGYSL